MRIAVTGAFGYSGRYIARRLLAAGHEVITLTNSMHRVNPFGATVPAYPFHFDEPHKLRETLRGVHTLVNTYWVRFDHRELGYWSCRLVGLFVGDVVITREEIRGLMEGRLYVDAPPLGNTKLTEWIVRHRDTLGRHYTSEMARRIDRVAEYRSN